MDADDPKYQHPRPDNYPAHYDYRVLEMAANIYEATQEYPLNPRDLGVRSLFLADMQWVSDLNVHMSWKQHHKDVLKAKKGR